VIELAAPSCGRLPARAWAFDERVWPQRLFGQGLKGGPWWASRGFAFCCAVIAADGPACGQWLNRLCGTCFAAAGAAANRRLGLAFNKLAEPGLLQPASGCGVWFATLQAPGGPAAALPELPQPIRLAPVPGAGVLGQLHRPSPLRAKRWPAYQTSSGTRARSGLSATHA